MLIEAVETDRLTKLREAVASAEHALERARIAANEAHFNLAAFNRTPAQVWATSKTTI